MQTGFSLANQIITLSGSYIQWLFASQRQLCHEKHLIGKEKKCNFDSVIEFGPEMHGQLSLACVCASTGHGEGEVISSAAFLSH